MKTFAACIFIVINQNKARNEYFYFTVNKNPLLAKAQASITTRFGQNKGKSKFQINNFVLLPNVVSHIFRAFYQKNSVFSFWTRPVSKVKRGVKGLGNSILQLAFKY